MKLRNVSKSINSKRNQKMAKRSQKGPKKSKKKTTQIALPWAISVILNMRLRNVSKSIKLHSQCYFPDHKLGCVGPVQAIHTVSSDNSSKMWPARPGPRVENDKSPDTNYFVGGHQAGQARLNIPENTQRWQISQNMIITESVHKIIYHLIFWETDGRGCLVSGSESGQLLSESGAELSRHLLVSSVTGQCE